MVKGAFDEATVTVFINTENDPPLATDDVFFIQEDAGDRLLDVLVNDSDPDGDTLRITHIEFDFYVKKRVLKFEIVEDGKKALSQPNIAYIMFCFYGLAIMPKHYTTPY